MREGELFKGMWGKWNLAKGMWSITVALGMDVSHDSMTIMIILNDIIIGKQESMKVYNDA